MSVAELRGNVAEVASDVKEVASEVKEQDSRLNTLTIEVRSIALRQDLHEKRDDERHGELVKRFDQQWAFIQKMLVGLGAAALSIIMALLGLLGANPDIIAKAMAGAAP